MQDFYLFIDDIGVIERIRSFETNIFREVRQRLTDTVKEAMNAETDNEDKYADSLALFRNKECVSTLSNNITTLVSRVIYACAVNNDTAEEGMLADVSCRMAEPLGYILDEFGWQQSDRYGGEVTEWLYYGSDSIIGIYMDWLELLKSKLMKWLLDYFKENPLVCSDGVHNIADEPKEWATFLGYASTVLTRYVLGLSRNEKAGYYEITNYVPYDRVAVRYFLMIIKDVLGVKVYHQDDKYNTFSVDTCAEYYIASQTSEWIVREPSESSDEDNAEDTSEDDDDTSDNYFTKYTLNLTEFDGEWYEWECEYCCQDFYLLVRNGSDTDKNFDTIRESNKYLKRRYPADMTTTL